MAFKNLEEFPAGVLTVNEVVWVQSGTAGVLVEPQISTPSNPPSGSNKLYFKTDGKLYSLSSGGVETLINGTSGAVNYKGTWDASTGVYPTGPVKGDYYIVNVAGTISGTYYGVGDWMVYDGTVWDKIDNQSYATKSLNNLASVAINTDLVYAPGTTKYIKMGDQTSINTDGNELAVFGGKGNGVAHYGGELALFGGQSGAGIDGSRLILQGGGIGQIDLIAGRSGILNITGADNSSLPGNNNGGNIVLAGGSASGIGTGGTINIQSLAQGYTTYAILDTHLLASGSNRTYAFPDKSGTFALTSDISGAAGSNTWVQYNNSGAFGASKEFTYLNGLLTVGDPATGEGGHTGELRTVSATTGFYTGFKQSDSSTASVTYIMPLADATSPGDILISDGAGNLSWTSGSITGYIPYVGGNQDVTFVKEVSRTISIADTTTTDGAGALIQIEGARGNGIGAGGAAVIYGGTNAGSGAAGGYVSAGGGTNGIGGTTAIHGGSGAFTDNPGGSVILQPGKGHGVGANGTLIFRDGSVSTSGHDAIIDVSLISGGDKIFTFPNSSGTLRLTTDVIAIAQGGTGQTSKTAAFDALSPMSNAGDIIYGGASGTGTRLAIGGANTVLHGGASVPAYSAVVEADITLANNTTNNTQLNKHGFCPALPSPTGAFLRDDGSWATPASVTVPFGYVSEAFAYTATTEHTITHNFGTYPVVQAFDNTATPAMVIPQIIRNITTSQIGITFSTSGTYTLVLTCGSPYLSAYVSTSVANYTVLANDFIVEETGSGKIVTLPTPVGRVGKQYIIKNSSAGICDVQTAAGNIDGVADVTLASGDSLTVCSNNSNWLVI